MRRKDKSDAAGIARSEQPPFVLPPGRFRAPFPGGYQAYSTGATAKEETPVDPGTPQSITASSDAAGITTPPSDTQARRPRRRKRATPIENSDPDTVVAITSFRERLDQVLADQHAYAGNGNGAGVNRSGSGNGRAAAWPDELRPDWADMTQIAEMPAGQLLDQEATAPDAETGEPLPEEPPRRRRRRKTREPITERTQLVEPGEEETEVLEALPGPDGGLDDRPGRRRRRRARRPVLDVARTPEKPAEPGNLLPPGGGEDVVPDTAGITDEFAGLTVSQLRRVLPPSWGRKLPASGRVSHVARSLEYQATTAQACGLYPFLAGSGAPSDGVPMGWHLLSGENVSYDPIAWLVNGLTTNPGLFCLGEPGSGKSSFVKRLTRGMAAYGIIPIFAGDVKPDYSGVVERLGGTVIRVGRGLDRINPLDTGPLGEAAAAMTGTAREQLLAEIRGRRLNALLALLSLVREYSISNGEESVLGVALDILDRGLEDKSGPEANPTVPDVLKILRNRDQFDRLMDAADVQTEAEFIVYTRDLRQTLNHLCEGSLKGVFDGPTTRPIDLKAPAISLDISQVSAAGDKVVGAAMLSAWANVFAVIDGAHALSEVGLGKRRRYAVVLDELWLAARSGGSGVINYMDALTRVNRAKGVADIRITHTLRDLEAVGNHADRAKAEGFVERASVVCMAALSKRELREVARLVPLTEAEMEMVSSWSNPEQFLAGAKHPGRGRYLLKPGAAPGIPIQLEYVGDEAILYNTDSRIIDDQVKL